MDHDVIIRWCAQKLTDDNYSGNGMNRDTLVRGLHHLHYMSIIGTRTGTTLKLCMIKSSSTSEAWTNRSTPKLVLSSEL